MRGELEATRSRPPVLKRAVAGMVLLAVAVLAVHFIVGLLVAVFWIVVAVAAIAVVLWALNTIL